MKSKEKLKPCPFCGSEAELIGNDMIQYFIRCPNLQCRIDCMTLDCQTDEEAIYLWNTRVGEEATR